MSATKLTASALVLVTLSVASRAHAEPFDHSAWDKLLKANVSEDGWVDYRSVRSKWKSPLRAYISRLGAASVDELSSVDERKAFWVNAYNALTIQKLIDAGLPAEVPNATFFGQNIFKERTYWVAGEVRSLDDIEHQILRKKFKDTRIHAALVCGASSCPRLRREAYSGKSLDTQLNQEAERWVRSGRTKKGERKNYLDQKAKTYFVSKIFDWFGEDFGGDDQGVLAFLASHGTPQDRAFLQANRVTIRYLTYDWTVNGKDSSEK